MNLYNLAVGVHSLRLVVVVHSLVAAAPSLDARLVVDHNQDAVGSLVAVHNLDAHLEEDHNLVVLLVVVLQAHQAHPVVVHSHIRRLVVHTLVVARIHAEGHHSHLEVAHILVGHSREAVADHMDQVEVDNRVLMVVGRNREVVDATHSLD